jgi:hypothetical protein
MTTPVVLAALERFSEIADSVTDEERARAIHDPEFIELWNTWHAYFADMEPEIARPLFAHGDSVTRNRRLQREADAARRSRL